MNKKDGFKSVMDVFRDATSEEEQEKNYEKMEDSETEPQLEMPDEIIDQQIQKDQFNFSGMRNMEPHAWMKYLDSKIMEIIGDDDSDSDDPFEEGKLEAYQDVRMKMFGKMLYGQ